MSRRQAATSLAAGLALIVAAPLVWWVAQPEPAGQTVGSVNAAVAQELASPVMTSGESREGAAPSAKAGSAAATGSGAVAGSTAAAPLGTTPSEPPSPATPPPPAPPPSAESVPAPGSPVRIEVPALGVDTTVVPVGVDSGGLMEIPQDVGTVGWYRFGPAPGAATGSAVLSGHVDDYRQGVGVFGRIGDLTPGESIRVTDDSGVAREFIVVAREEWAKDTVPLDRIFDRGGSARLVLITCGGSFNSDTLGYDDNIAVTAVPAMS